MDFGKELKELEENRSVELISSVILAPWWS